MLNCINIHGRITQDLEIKNTVNGSTVLSFSVACDYFSNGQKSTDFFNVVAWNNNAQFIKAHFNKGDDIIISGRLRSRKYQTQAGENRTVVEILVNQSEFAGGKRNTQEPAQQAAPTQAEPAQEYTNEVIGELPFEV